MLSKIVGDSRFKVGDGFHTWSELPWSTTTFTNGLIEKDGIVSVDFSQMPIERYESLLKSLRLPIWLSEDTNFYVDGTNGSDILSEGRGLSSELAFKTIQACIDYVCENYNITSYRAIILINKGTYSGITICKDFQKTTGYIKLCPYPNITRDQVILQNNSIVISIIGGQYIIVDLTLKLIKDLSLYSSETWDWTLGVSNYSIVTIWGLKIILETLNNFKAGGRLVFRHIYVGNTAELFLDGRSSSENSLEIYVPATFTSGTETLYIFWIEGHLTHINFGTTKNPELIISGQYKSCMFITNGGLANFSMLGQMILYKSGNPMAKGMRYECTMGGKINSGGRGVNYFIGTTAGIVESDTYSWYK